ncbi:MAG: DUF4301 family protein, partial [Psychroflexus maritimus]
MKLSDENQKLINQKNISLNQLKHQVDTFIKGIPPIQLMRPATIGDGILTLNKKQIESYIGLYESTNEQVLKFTPASGAATRMFKKLHSVGRPPLCAFAGRLVAREGGTRPGKVRVAGRREVENRDSFRF